MPVADKKLLRMIDVNFNRAKEGLRVCEDICRYVLDAKSLTKKYKKTRHELTAIVESLGLGKVIAARDIAGDVGRVSTAAEFKRKGIDDIFYANSQRVKESIRVLEETTKLLNSDLAERLKKLRYQIYAVEKDMVKRC